MNMLWQIIGELEEVSQEHIGGDFVSEYSYEVVATFDEESLAEEYIKESKLKQRKRVTYGSDIVFKSGSLLRPYVSARIEKYEIPDIPPHNPDIE